ncbi:hypothetical protein KAR91_64330 [Candidatus Pacearchaeota archaeon]|nr:hypothetical protein [Candidatus Pacearchaeota archaeon]
MAFTQLTKHFMCSGYKWEDLNGKTLHIIKTTDEWEEDGYVHISIVISGIVLKMVRYI